MDMQRSARKRARPAWMRSEEFSNGDVEKQVSDGEKHLVEPARTPQAKSTWLIARRMVNLHVPCVMQGIYCLFRCFMACEPSISTASIFTSMPS